MLISKWNVRLLALTQALRGRFGRLMDEVGCNGPHARVSRLGNWRVGPTSWIPQPGQNECRHRRAHF